MALKNKKGNYLRIGRIEGIDVYSGRCYPRIYQHDTEEDENDHPMEPDKNFCIHEVELSDKDMKKILDIMYKAVKVHKVKAGEVKHEAETDEKCDVVKESYTEDVYEMPYSDYTDC